MGPVGRLWRRAPAWRLLLVTAVATTALAAMFPPALPPGLIRFHHGTRAAAFRQNGQFANTAASFTPQPVQALPDYEAVKNPPLGTPRSGTIPFDGRQLPLPPGEWQMVELGRLPADSGKANVRVQSFVQLKSREVTGVLVTLTPDPVSGGVPPPNFMQTCLAAGASAGHVAPLNPADPLANECWVLTDAVLSATKGGAPGSVYLPELDRFRVAGLSVPEHMVVLDYRHSDRNGWLVLTFFSDESARSLESRRVPVWAKTYAAAVRRGFEARSR
jgi:hypothetical protein